MRHAQAVLGARPEANDAAQEALLRAWRSAASCHTPERPQAWVRAIAHREALRWYARHAREAPTDLDDSVMASDCDVVGAAERIVLRAAVRHLGAQDRRIFVLHYWADLSCGEIAEAMGMPVATVKVRLHRGRRALRATLISSGAGDPERR